MSTTKTSAATSVQLARASLIGRELQRAGFTATADPAGTHPGAHSAVSYAHPALKVQVITLGGRGGQIFEITATRVRRVSHNIKARRIARPAWRLTSYDPPVSALIAAALAGCEAPTDADGLETAGWSVHRPLRNHPTKPYVTTFTRPDTAVTAAFHTPTFSPPCERCRHHGDLGDTGGWLVSGPGFTADASAHTPEHVVTAFLLALPGGSPAPAPRVEEGLR